jgi:prepilin-type N-terminal cleavage/methylation domain-containing protein/prepilin-type processing-associated H-X9-DG protein
MKKGFTLIELLVVIAIIAILAAILFPVFSEAKAAAYKISCLNNIKQITLGAVMYQNDYDDTLPSAAHSNGGAGMEGGWMFYSRFPADDDQSPGAYIPQQGSIFPYVKNANIFVCPMDPKGKVSGNSYSMNYCATDQAGGVAHGKNSSSIDDSSAFLFFNEEADGDPSTDSTDDGYFLYPGNNMSVRHTKGSNGSFVDGHGKFILPGALAANGWVFGSPDLTSCP